MKDIFAKWIGKTVTVNSNPNTSIGMKGKLLAADELGFLLEITKGHVFFPMAAILNVSLLAEDLQKESPE